MPNAFDPSLINKILSQRALTKVEEKLAYLNDFTTDFSDEVASVRARVCNVPFVSSGSAGTQLNPTDFEIGGADVANRVVNLDHHYNAQYITAADYQNGFRLEHLMDISIQEINRAIENKLFALFTETNYPTGVVSYPAAGGGIPLSALNSLWTGVPGDFKVAYVDQQEMKPLIQSDLFKFPVVGPNRVESAYGWDVLSWSGKGFNSAGSGIKAFGANPAGVVIAAKIPEYTTAVADLLDSTIVTSKTGLSLMTSVWASAKTRQTWFSVELLLGCAIGDPNAVRVAKAV